MADHVDTVVLEDEYLDAAREYRDIVAQEKALAARKAQLREIIEKALAVGERAVTPDGEPLVAITAGSARFDPIKASKALPADVFNTILVLAPDAKRARDVLAPALYEQCCEYTRPSLRAL